MRNHSPLLSPSEENQQCHRQEGNVKTLPEFSGPSAKMYEKGEKILLFMILSALPTFTSDLSKTIIDIYPAYNILPRRSLQKDRPTLHQHVKGNVSVIGPHGQRQGLHDHRHRVQQSGIGTMHFLHAPLGKFAGICEGYRWDTLLELAVSPLVFSNADSTVN